MVTEAFVQEFVQVLLEIDRREQVDKLFELLGARTELTEDFNELVNERSKLSAEERQRREDVDAEDIEDTDEAHEGLLSANFAHADAEERELERDARLRENDEERSRLISENRGEAFEEDLRQRLAALNEEISSIVEEAQRTLRR